MLARTIADRLHDIGMKRNRPGLHNRVVGLTSWALWMTLKHVGHPMGKGREVRAISTMWAWQLWRRIVRRPIVVTLPDRSRLLCPSWSRLAATHASYGFHEYAETLFVMDFLRSSDVFVDVGANIGYYTVIAARLGSRVHAFEPADRCRDVLEFNARLNTVNELVEITPLALSDFEGMSQFNEVEGDIMAKLVMNSSSSSLSVVQVTTLDTACRGSIPTLIKIDAEGFDFSVLKGGRETLLANVPPILIEIWQGGREIRNWLSEFGYDFYQYDPSIRRLGKLPSAFAGDATVIAVADRGLSLAHERLSTAPRISLIHPKVSWRDRVVRQYGR